MGVSTDLAQQTIERIDSALKSGKVASMPELVRIIRALTKDESRTSITELADLIQQDSTVLVRVIAAANTFGYNPTNVKISTVEEAIHTIGFNRVRMLSMSLMLLEHAGRSSTPMEQRQMATISLCSGLVAQVAASHAGAINPELAFVCASLRNFGRLLLGTFMTDDFRAAMDAANQGLGDDAYREKFGLTPFDLGYELLKTANLPAVILNAVKKHEVPSDGKLDWADKAVRKLASFSLELSELALNPDVTDANFSKVQAELVRKNRRDFPFLAERAPNLLKQAEQRLAQLSHASGGASFGQVGRERLRHRAKRTPISGKPELDHDSTPLSRGPQIERHPPVDEAETAHESAAPAPGVQPAAASETTVDREALSKESNPPRRPNPKSTVAPPPPNAMQDALELLRKNPTQNNALPIALNAVWRSLRPQDLFFCALDPTSHAFRIALGNGPLSDRLGSRTLFRQTDRNIFYLCHDRFVNLSIRDTRDTRVRKHLPEWMKAPDSPRAFLALPVHHEKHIQGILIVGWDNPRPEPYGGKGLEQLGDLFGHVAEAFLHQAA